MSGGGGQPSSSTTTAQLPDWAQPYAQQILQRGAALSNQAIPQYGGQTVADMSGMQTQGLQQIQDLASGGGAGVNAANQAVTGILQGNNQYNYTPTTTQVGTNPYIGQNPYLQGQVAAAQKQVTDAYRQGTAPQTMAQFRNAGAFGGSAMQQQQAAQNQVLGNTLANTATQMYGQDYANTQQLAQAGIQLGAQTSLADAARNAQYGLAGQTLNNQTLLNAAQLAPGLGQAQYTGAQALLNAGQLAQQQQQNQLNSQYQQWYNNAMQPYQQLGLLQQALSGALGVGAQGTTTSTQNQGRGSTMGGVLGGAATGAGLGSTFGPWGTAIGGVGGGLMGLFT